MALRKHQKVTFNPKIAPCLRANHHNTEDIHYILVYGQTKLTNTPVKSTEKTLEEEMDKGYALRTRKRKCHELEIRKDNAANSLTQVQKDSMVVSMKGANSMKETSQKSQPTLFPTMTSWLEDFLVKHSRLQVNVEGSMTPEELSFLKSHGFSGTSDPDVFYSKTLRAYYLTTLEKLSKPYLKHSPTLGIESNGRYLILKTSEFHRTGKECSLSDILESEVEDKYFLSQDKVDKLMEQFTHA